MTNSKTPSLYGAYNARWLSPREVADGFVPIPQFNRLVETQSSVLMGPRGCGKTTLLKMLTPEAQGRWRERVEQERELAERATVPDFLAVYVPSDLRWTAELAQSGELLGVSTETIERLQRYLITISALTEASRAFETLVVGLSGVERGIARAFADQWKESRFVPTLGHLRARLELYGATLRGALNSRSSEHVGRALDALPSYFGAHAVDALAVACSVFESEVGKGRRPSRWALCFDELEIAPSWLQNELLRALRSLPGLFLLKLTWTPILPALLRRRATNPEHRQDFEPIKLWQSYLGDSDDFARELTTRIVVGRLREPSITPGSLFGNSLFATDHDANSRVYAKGSQFWKTVIALAEQDKSFELFLRRKKIDPRNPSTRSRRKRDQVLRKIKPIVLLRHTFGVPGKRRSRKNPTLYSGEHVIYAMSDGNPRWLAGIVNELIELARDKALGKPVTRVSRQVQSDVLLAASKRMRLHVKHLPVATDILGRPAARLHEVVERLGRLCHEEVLGVRFTDDPVGSFLVDGKASGQIAAAIEAGLTLGAFIAITELGRTVPEILLGTRFRLSFMLAPSFTLLFRNYRWVSLSTALTHSSLKQRESRTLFDEES
jgi:hypothetical protein